jgi:alpha-L-rhamnosidase
MTTADTIVWFILVMDMVLAGCAATQSAPTANPGRAIIHAIPVSTPAPANAEEAALSGRSPIPEPYPYVSGGTFCGPPVPTSSDPLVQYRWSEPKATDGLQIFVQHPEKVDTDHPGSFSGLDSLKTATPAVIVNGPGTIRVDFGRENAGWFEIDSADCPGSLRLSISEYNRPEYTNIGDKTVVPEHIGNTWRAKFNADFFEGVRFGFIHVDAVTKPWHISGIRLICQVKPANYEGSFTCSDPLLNRVWQMCAYSLKVANLKDYTTTILISRGDRDIWNGLDFYEINTASLAIFFDQAFVRQQLARVNTVPGINCGIFGYELYDVLSICEYYLQTGDVSLVRECKGVVTAKLARAQERWTPYVQLNAPGIAGYMGCDERLGSVFETVTEYNRCDYRLLCIHAWLAWAEVMDRLHDSAARDHYRQLAQMRILEVRKDPNWAKKLDVHGCAEAVQAGFCTPAEITTMVDGEFSDRVNRVSYSQANTSLIVEAMGMAGLYDEALVTLEDQWGAALRYGGTTTFEMFHPSAADALGANDPPINGQCGTTSLCHPWGALPCQYLNEVVAGIHPTSPGYDTVDIMSHLGRLLTSVRATTPTAHGPISVSIDATTGTGRFVIPPGIVARIGFPKLERRITSVSLTKANPGNTVNPGDGVKGWPAIPKWTEDDQFIIFSGVAAGTYDCSVAYAGTTPAPHLTSIIYPVSCLGEDRTTQGNWGGVYGRDGFVLPDYDGIGKDLRSLPSYVSAVTMSHCKQGIWATNVQDARAPACRADNSGPRTAAMMYTGDPEATFQTMVTDIAAQSGHSYTLSLYFLDWDGHDRSVGVEIIDAASLKQLAAVRVVKNFHDGVYLSYRCMGPVRVRIDTITEPNATLSGIFFSP